MAETTRDVPISPVDAASFQLGVHVQPYLVTIAGLLSPGGFVDRDGRPDPARLHRTLAPHIAQESLLRQQPIMRNGSWWWTESNIEVDLHVSIVERGPTEPDFEAICARLVMQSLDPTRPLWHISLVPAARPGQCGIVIRVHHAVLDGARATDLFERLFASPDPKKPDSGASSAANTRHSPESHIPQRASFSDLLRFRIGTFLHRPIRSRVLLGSIGTTRSIASASTRTAPVERGARRAGGTLNDAYLVAAGAGLRFILEERGEPIPKTIAVSVPVAVAAIGNARNAVGFMIVDLPLRETPPDRAVALVAKQTAAAKPSARAAGTTFRSPRIAGLFDKFAKRQHMIGAVISNVHGPHGPLALDGAALVELWPLGPLAGNVRVGFTAASYNEYFWIGIQADAEHLPPASKIAHAVKRALDEIASTAI
ncbi:wax ester/triacylglycerol synthase domain-containing protein [Rhodococcus sp. (in: high G+C Gram-positive bacteria)]|uniref:wax ester/triacylglycerol synthase domain-containing protein n=1 Tax=Rhodococcus sp. TaxID=1831 RepID=UPI003314EFA2